MRGKGYAYFLALAAVPFILSGCPDGGCLKGFTLKGTVEDGASSPISGVEVYLVGPGSSPYLFATPDSNGEYSYTVGKYSNLGDFYLVFKKIGYQDFSTQSQPIGDGNGLCEDQVIVRDAVMAP